MVAETGERIQRHGRARDRSLHWGVDPKDKPLEEQALRQRMALAQTARQAKSSDPATLLRFVAFRCEFTPEGVRASYRDAPPREIAWSEVASFSARQLPGEKPWDGAIVADLVPSGPPGVAPIRLLTGSFIPFGALVGGAATSPVENVRRLGAHILLLNPELALEPATEGFVCDGKPCPRVLSLNQFADYDARYS